MARCYTGLLSVSLALAMGGVSGFAPPQAWLPRAVPRSCVSCSLQPRGCPRVFMDGRPEPSQAGARRAGHGRSSRDGTKSRKQRVPGTTRQHIALNKQILGSEHEQELSALVNERHSDFNGVNLASAYTKLLLGKFSGPPSRRGPNELGSHECELALAVLEVEMTKNTTVFGARECANLLHAVAKSQRQPCKPSLLPSLQVRVDQVAPDLTAQGIANVFWANAKMGIRPGSGVVEALTRRSQVEPRSRCRWV